MGYDVASVILSQTIYLPWADSDGGGGHGSRGRGSEQPEVAIGLRNSGTDPLMKQLDPPREVIGRLGSNCLTRGGGGGVRPSVKYVDDFKKNHDPPPPPPTPVQLC